MLHMFSCFQLQLIKKLQELIKIEKKFKNHDLEIKIY